MERRLNFKNRPVRIRDIEGGGVLNNPPATNRGSQEPVTIIGWNSRHFMCTNWRCMVATDCIIALCMRAFIFYNSLWRLMTPGNKKCLVIVFYMIRHTISISPVRRCIVGDGRAEAKRKRSSADNVEGCRSNILICVNSNMLGSITTQQILKQFSQ